MGQEGNKTISIVRKCLTIRRSELIIRQFVLQMSLKWLDLIIFIFLLALYFMAVNWGWLYCTCILHGLYEEYCCENRKQ